jgi:hypothetical protein
LVLAGLGIAMLAAVLWWYRRRRPRAGGVPADPACGATRAETPDGPTVAAELRRRPAFLSLLIVGAVALVVAPAFVALSPALWLILLVGLCAAAPVAWRHQAEAAQPRPPPGAASDDEPTLELDIGLLGLRRRLGRKRTAALAAVGPVVAVAAVTVVLLLGGHVRTPHHRAAAAPAPSTTGPTTSTTAPPTTVPTAVPPAAATGAAPAVPFAPATPSPTPPPAPPPAPDPLTTLLQVLR